MFGSNGRMGKLPPAMPPEQITYEWFAEAYHFTEEQTAGLSLDALEWWPVIRMGKAMASERKQQQEQRLQQSTTRRGMSGSF